MGIVRKQLLERSKNMDSIKTQVTKEVLNAVSENTGFWAKKKSFSKKKAGKCAFAFGTIALFLSVFSCTVNEENSYDNGINGPGNGNNFSQTSNTMAFNVRSEGGAAGVRNGLLEERGGKWRIIMEWREEYKELNISELDISSVGNLPTAFAAAIQRAAQNGGPDARVQVELTILDTEKYGQAATSVTPFSQVGHINPALAALGLDADIINALLEKFHAAVQDAANASAYPVTAGDVKNYMNLYINAENRGNYAIIPLTTQEDGIKIILDYAQGAARIEWSRKFRGNMPNGLGTATNTIVDRNMWGTAANPSQAKKDFDAFFAQFGGGDSIKLEILPKTDFVNDHFIHAPLGNVNFGDGAVIHFVGDALSLLIFLNRAIRHEPTSQGNMPNAITDLTPFKLDFSKMIVVGDAFESGVNTGNYPDLPDTLRMSSIAEFKNGQWAAKPGLFIEDNPVVTINGYEIRRSISHANILLDRPNISDIIVTKIEKDAVLGSLPLGNRQFTNSIAFVNGLIGGPSGTSWNPDAIRSMEIIFDLKDTAWFHNPRDLAGFSALSSSVGVKGNILVNNSETNRSFVHNRNNFSVFESDGKTVSNRLIISSVNNGWNPVDNITIFGGAQNTKVMFGDFERFWHWRFSGTAAQRDNLIRVLPNAKLSMPINATRLLDRRPTAEQERTAQNQEIANFASFGFHLGGIGLDGEHAYADITAVGSLGRFEAVRVMAYAFGRNKAVQYQQFLETGTGIGDRSATAVKNWIDTLGNVNVNNWLRGNGNHALATDPLYNNTRISASYFDGAEWRNSINPENASGRNTLVRGLVDGAQGIPFIPLQLVELADFNVLNAVIYNGTAAVNRDINIGRRAYFENVRIDMTFVPRITFAHEGSNYGLIYFVNHPRYFRSNPSYLRFGLGSGYVAIENFSGEESVMLSGRVLDLTQIKGISDFRNLPAYAESQTIIYPADTDLSTRNPGNFPQMPSVWQGTATSRSLVVDNGASYLTTAQGWADVIGIYRTNVTTATTPNSSVSNPLNLNPGFVRTPNPAAI